MAEEQDEAVLRITARYVADVEAGRRPQLSDYLRCYPQYADAIADFVAYYQAIEADASEENEILPPASEVSTLLVTADHQHLTPSSLAHELDISADLVELLECRLIDPATVPERIPIKLAFLLQYPVSAIQAYLNHMPQRRKGVSQAYLRRKVAEEPAAYAAQGSSALRKLSFREAVSASVGLSSEQKASWLAILEEDMRL